MEIWKISLVMADLLSLQLFVNKYYLNIDIHLV